MVVVLKVFFISLSKIILRTSFLKPRYIRYLLTTICLLFLLLKLFLILFRISFNCGSLISLKTAIHTLLLPCLVGCHQNPKRKRINRILLHKKGLTIICDPGTRLPLYTIRPSLGVEVSEPALTNLCHRLTKP